MQLELAHIHKNVAHLKQVSS